MSTHIYGWKAGNPSQQDYRFEAHEPAPNEQELGGHAVLVVGYRDADQRFIVRNSWGSSWGDAGHFYMPYQYLLSSSLSSDFWTIRTVL